MSHSIILYMLISHTFPLLIVYLAFFFFFFLAYESSQARDWIGAVAASLHHSHSDARSEPRLRPTPQLVAMPDPLIHGDQTQGLNWSCNCQPVPQPRCQIWAMSVTYTTTHSSAGSLTHWVRLGIKLVSSWILVRFITCWAITGTPIFGQFWHVYTHETIATIKTANTSSNSEVSLCPFVIHLSAIPTFPGSHHSSFYRYSLVCISYSFI